MTHSIRLLPALALCLGLALPLSSQAAPLTGHTVNIIFYDDGTNAELFNVFRTVGAGPELTVADDPFLGVSDFVDIDAGSISFFSDGAGPASSNGFVAIEVALPTGVFFTSFGISSGSMAGAVQGLSERYLFDAVNWGAGGSLVVEGLAVDVAATTVPVPAALALLGLGLTGFAARRRKRG